MSPELLQASQPTQGLPPDTLPSPSLRKRKREQERQPTPPSAQQQLQGKRACSEEVRGRKAHAQDVHRGDGEVDVEERADLVIDLQDGIDVYDQDNVKGWADAWERQCSELAHREQLRTLSDMKWWATAAYTYMLGRAGSL